MTPEFAELRRLAEAATPGPWDYYRPHPNYRAYEVGQVMPGGYLGEAVATTEDVYAEKNAAFIAAANPAAVLALLDAADERDALAAKVERVRALHFGEYVEDEDRNRCWRCGGQWPCSTARAVDEEPQQ